MHLALRRHEPNFISYFSLGLVAGLLGFMVGPELVAMQEPEEPTNAEIRLQASLIERAEVAVKRYAFEAFPAWAVDHPDRRCPESRSELDEYAGLAGFDPWLTPYKVGCMPSGMLVAWSFGPDGVENTADDVSSR